MTVKKKIILNLFGAILVTIIHACINLFLSPYIIKTIGVEAQGFIQLATNFVTYISIITIAFNSMSGRFISIEIQKKDNNKANSYYTSVFWGNLVLFTLLLLPLILCVLFLDKIINIPQSLVIDVKILFSFSFITLIAANILSIWNNIFYIEDRIYLQSIGESIKFLLRAIVIIVLYFLFYPKMWYYGIAGFIVTLFSAFWSLYFKIKYKAELKVRKILFSMKHLKEIISSGIWRSVQLAGEMMLTGLDLLFCNLFIGTVQMGILALSKVIPTMIQSLNSQIVISFAPKLTRNYVINDKEAIWRDIKRAFKITSIIGTIPLGGLIVYGRDFFQLWIPSQDASLLQLLSILVCSWMALITGVQPINNIFITVNKVKPQAVSIIFCGVLNIIIVMTVIHLTNYGMIAIAITSGMLSIARYLFYTIPISAIYINFKWYRFYLGVFYSIITTSSMVIIGIIVRVIIRPYTWFMFVVSCAIAAVLALFASCFILLDKYEKNVIIKTLNNILKIPKNYTQVK